jgi:predicted ester cyclase
MEDFLRAFPDVHNSISLVITDDNVLATEFTIAATHTGPLALPSGEVAPTGKKLTFSGASFARINAQGLIVEEHRYWDVLAHLVQLGLLPEAEAVP